MSMRAFASSSARTHFHTSAIQMEFHCYKLNFAFLLFWLFRRKKRASQWLRGSEKKGKKRKLFPSLYYVSRCRHIFIYVSRALELFFLLFRLGNFSLGGENFAFVYYAWKKKSRLGGLVSRFVYAHSQLRGDWVSAIMRLRGQDDDKSLATDRAFFWGRVHFELFLAFYKFSCQ